MSRRYDMHIAVKGLKEEHKALVEESISTKWNADYGFMEPIEEDGESTWQFLTGGEGSLCGGETEEEFTGRVAESIWEALGYYVSVIVTATYLEDLPHETLSMEEEEYAGYLKRICT